jgi:hypothetical protein
MKTALVRMLTLISLATSLTCHAAAAEARHNDSVSPSARQNECAGQGKKQKEKKGHDNSTSEQDFDRLLMGIYG